jgi:hypothetical protein
MLLNCTQNVRSIYKRRVYVQVVKHRRKMRFFPDISDKYAASNFRVTEFGSGVYRSV